ncbi:hypothetical protein [Thermocoleostomius sinensis]|jgi:hypothetical protein|uniref:LSDAT prokaryote domain-containing protein n=1 Tax=Thermocoleostomius sinensis A174 TaxID=2016057 RepID=A0A9E9C8W1_9CYAN|nr:hypothetical protein [Thermocoleostomius sinensis]WAL60723.1 hypothetical protein OXH18_01620 [Thermocoleostomius sinensis A174]
MLSSNLSSLLLTFSSGQTAKAIEVPIWQALPSALEAVGLSKSRPVLVLIGGACQLDPEDSHCLHSLFVEFLAPVVEELGITVVDGGTDAGVMRLMGQARAAINASFPLVGVVPVGKVHLPNANTPGKHGLEPHHTHFILIPGQRWGDESRWIATIASLLSNGEKSLTLLINGGTIASVDVQSSIAEGRPVMVMAGTGRLADQIAVAMQRPELAFPPLSALIHMGAEINGLTVCDATQSTQQLSHAFKDFFAIDTPADKASEVMTSTAVL